ncbi:alkaline phosphatase family protein [Stenotrophomonas rhizophila]|uniref:alkaline phosphatase family protein n=1 Tax=Stenotrophomonas rhizophila TaxID=216778 RepID=UPI001E3E0A32|nr:alkaline phosphatase family protein [Stenotrophomonas rhizophila]MCC7633214.1 alkaline phosphatase family protein [Stenotrophomonas rhizophila]MCC7662107.1 alkaline phosphatase family protein [Stenotrophomonas rhizophila]
MTFLLLRPLLALALLPVSTNPAHADQDLAAPAHPAADRKALLIGVDGMQYERLLDAIEAGMAPNIGSLPVLAKSYVGGINETQTAVTSGSGPGWTTMLTGTWADRHRVPFNDDLSRSLADSVFKQIKLAAPSRRTVSIVSWDTINNNFANDVADGYLDLAYKCSNSDACVVNRVIDEIETGNPDFVFAHTNDPDTTGHGHGIASQQYLNKIQQVDRQVGQILAALERRQLQHPNEDWLVIVATDHGFKLDQPTYHGCRTISEKTTFIAMNKPANAELTHPIPYSGTALAGWPEPEWCGMHDPIALQNLYGHASQADITPTILRHMGVAVDISGHQMAGIPLIGTLGARQLSYVLDPADGSVTLDWRLTGPDAAAQLVRVFRNGVPIAALTGAEHYIDRNPPAGTDNLDYTVVTRNTAASVLALRDGSGLP